MTEYERDTEKPSIEPLVNGPNYVKNLKAFKNSRGETIPTQSDMYLCRCGGSSDKPFRDRTHIRIGFQSDKSSDRAPDRLDDYVGRDITIHDNRGICAHSGYCTDNSPAVFHMGHKPHRVVGGIELNDPAGFKPESKEHYTLCRCGGSKNKPFCSGEHWHTGFKDDKN